MLLRPTSTWPASITRAGSRSPRELRLLAEDVIKPRFERVPGVAAVNVSGGLVREIRVDVEDADGRSPGGKQPRCGAANAAAGAGHQHDLTA